MDLVFAFSYLAFSIAWVITTIYLAKKDLFFQLIFIMIFPSLSICVNALMRNYTEIALVYRLGVIALVAFCIFFFFKNFIKRFNRICAEKLGPF